MALYHQLRHATKYPSHAINFLTNQPRFKALFPDQGELATLMKEAEQVAADVRAEHKDAPFGPRLAQKDLYLVVRAAKPEVVMETGVASGLSSLFILKALKENGSGKLYSIDLPGSQCEQSVYELKDEDVGFMVPKGLKKNWSLNLGKSEDIMPKLLDKEIDGLNIFIHDSLHTYDHMMWEYIMAWKHLKDGGLLLSHDTNTSDAFFDLTDQLPSPFTWTPSRGYGIIKKA
jgi:predicted O-methyltransferase YrrM